MSRTAPLERLRAAAGAAAIMRLTRWSARRHGRDTLPLTVRRNRIYILPTRFGLLLGLLLGAMLLAGLNYNSNLALVFGFFMASFALVAMHHCHRNLLGLAVDAYSAADAFAGGDARLEFTLLNGAPTERCDIQIRLVDSRMKAGSAGEVTVDVLARGAQRAVARVPVGPRGVMHIERFEMRTRYPFGWFRAWTYVQAPLAVFVAPQPSGSRAAAAATANVGATTPTAQRGDEEFAGLRPYVAGMSLKHMAWKVIARGGEAAVRSYGGRAAEPEWFDWHVLAGIDPETRLAQLCRWVLEAASARRRYGLRLPGGEVAPSSGTAHRRACLRALAEHPPPARDGKGAT